MTSRLLNAPTHSEANNAYHDLYVGDQLGGYSEGRRHTDVMYFRSLTITTLTFCAEKSG